MMFTRIVIPLDGSPFAERALPVAAEFANTYDAEIFLVRVAPITGRGEKEPGVVSYLDEHRIRIAQQYLTGAAATLRLGQPVSAEAYLAPDVVTGILERVLDIGADTVLLTTHGESWPVGDRLGSTASRLIREAPCPVVVVGPRFQAEAGQREEAGTAGLG
jgi:nucleotide-binding universal stress UspA family protein